MTLLSLKDRANLTIHWTDTFLSVGIVLNSMERERKVIYTNSVGDDKN